MKALFFVGCLLFAAVSIHVARMMGQLPTVLAVH
jgi:hypothetical protein